LAFSLPDSELPDPSEQIRLLAGRRPIVALSPIAYAKPVNWPTPNKAIYDRYLQQMGGILTGLVQQGYFVVVVCSSLGDDETVIPDLLNIVGNEVKQAMREQIFFPPIKTWRDLVAVLRETDYLIASRLHGTILSFVSKTPVVAISFDPKVDWVMEDLKQSEYLLHITDFTADDALKALKRVGADWDAAVERISLYRQSIASETARQFEYVTGLALKHHQYHN
jgi:polysaccharide pyruvyl transferase WcaK-like protein